MRRRLFTGILWKLILYSLALSLFISLVAMAGLLSMYRLDLQTLWLTNVPRAVLFAGLIFLAGLVPGYWYGTRLKRRMEKLTESTVYFERGHFTHRVPDSLTLSHDEIGWMGTHLNEMADRVERQVASLQKLATEKSQMAAQLKSSAVLEERQRIARDLHDAVSQQLFAISMMTAAIQESEDLNADKVRKRIGVVQSLAGEAQKEMRALLMQLRPASLEGKSLKTGLEELLQQYAEKHELELHWELEDVPELPQGVADHLFRILQESLSNVIRHAQATTVHIRLSQLNKQLHLKIVDDGIGFDAAALKLTSYGMRTLQERAIEIGGVANVLSLPGKGTQIHVRVPIVDREGEIDS